MHAALVIMAAGVGARYGGNKQTDGVGPNGEILMQYSVFDAVRAGFDRVVFVVKPGMQPLLHRLCGEMASRMHTPDGREVEVRCAVQDMSGLPDFYTLPPERTKPFGTGHAALCAQQAVREPFCLINADDYYGVDAYRILYQALQELPERGAAAMVGFRLKNTVSDHGTVSRGVCRVENGRLCGIREVLDIALLPDGTIRDGETGAVMDPDTVVSMNCWGFTPDIFRGLERYFHAFLRSPEAQSPRAEYMLPATVGALMDEGALTVSVLHSEDRWFGMTYQQDRARVAQALKQLHEAGVYPAELR